jgi:hypothetical protein
VPFSYGLRREEPDTWRLTLAGALSAPPGGIIVLPPLPRPLVQAEINGRNSTAFAPEWARCGECPADMVLRS